MYFLIVEPEGDAFARAGVLELKESFDTFSQRFQFEERLIKVL